MKVKSVVLCVVVMAQWLALEARTLEVAVWRGETRTIILDDKVKLAQVPKGVEFTEGSARNVRWSEKKQSKKNPKKTVIVRHQLADRVEWDSTAEGRRVLSIAVQPDAKPGIYEVGDLRLTILNRVLPPAKDWQYALDLWQHPWAVARTAKVAPFSPEHYTAMRPIWEQLAAAGQKALTVTLLDLPWNHQCYDGYHSMIRHIKQANGTWKFDYSIFDEYVVFGRSCGLGPDIACYTMCPWGYKVTWENEKGETASAKAVPGTPAFAEYWGDFLVDFARHLKEKGWFDDTYLAMDERKPEDVKNICEFIQRKAPGLKTSLCGNRAPSEFEGIRLDYVCFGFRHLTDKLLAEAAARRAAGMRTTYYVCCSPMYPNSMCHNRLEESFWLGVYPAMVGLDGFLRWAWNSWPKEPMKDASFGKWPAGDTFLVYPDNSPSLRFLMLKNGIIAAEKIRILKEQGLFKDEIAALASRFDRAAALKNETDFKAIEESVQQLVNRQ